ncbi:MAG: NADPH-dependent F420 reductase [Gemmatimonadota bacterium]
MPAPDVEDQERKMKIAVIGRGSVGGALAPRFAEAGHDVVVGARRPAPSARPPQTGVADAARDADVVVLAVPWEEVEAVRRETGALAGKIVVDCTNPIGAGLTHAPVLAESGTRHPSGGEATRALYGDASVVKAFATVGAPAMADPVYEGGRPFMPVCGGDARARKVVCELVEEVGFQAVDAGPMRKAVHLEHLALLWITMAHETGLGRQFAMGLLGR